MIKRGTLAQCAGLELVIYASNSICKAGWTANGVQPSISRASGDREPNNVAHEGIGP